MKVIFLDIDGVLNVIPQGQDKYGGIFHQHFVDNLAWIIQETGAKIVVSSSWRHSGLQFILDMWRDRDLPGEVVDITGDRLDLDCFSFQRGVEIQEWLDVHPEVTKYVILDDDGDMLRHQWPNFVQTSFNTEHPDCIDIGYGLTRICSEKVINILN